MASAAPCKEKKGERGLTWKETRSKLLCAYLEVDVDLGAAAQGLAVGVLRDRKGAIRTRLPDVPAAAHVIILQGLTCNVSTRKAD